MSRWASGIALLLGFVAAQAVRDVWLGAAFGRLGLFEIALLAFGGAALVFGGALLLFARSQLVVLTRHWRLVALANLTTCVAWLSYFQALDRAPAAAVNLAFSAVAPVTVLALGWLGWAQPTDGRANPLARAAHAGLLLVALLLLAAAIQGLIGPAGRSTSGLLLAITAGLLITGEAVVAKRLSEAGATAIGIVGLRFVGVALVAGAMVAGQQTAFAGLSGGAIAVQAGVLLLILVAPIVMAQAGLARTSPLASGVVLAFGPLATMALQAVVQAKALPPVLMAVVLGYALLALVAATALARDQAAS